MQQGRRYWSKEQQNLISRKVAQNAKWSQISDELKHTFGSIRSGKQCRERWLYHLNPDISHADWTRQQEQYICKMIKHVGNRWSQISKKMDGRSDNCLKNHFYSGIRKSLRWVNKVLISSKQFKPIKDDILSKIMNKIQPLKSIPARIYEDLTEKMNWIKTELYEMGVRKLYKEVSQDDFKEFALILAAKITTFNQLHNKHLMNQDDHQLKEDQVKEKPQQQYNEIKTQEKPTPEPIRRPFIKKTSFGQPLQNELTGMQDNIMYELRMMSGSYEMMSLVGQPGGSSNIGSGSQFILTSGVIVPFQILNQNSHIQ